MATQKPKESPAYAGQIQEIDVRHARLPCGLSSERIVESARELDFPANWLWTFF